MNWLDRLERHLGFLAIPNLVLAIIIGQALTTLLALKDPTVPMQLWLDPAAVDQGQWWRVVTWVIVPATRPLGMVLSIIWFSMLWTMGRTFELEWGTFKATVYVLLGVLVPSLGSMALWRYAGIPSFMTGYYFSTGLMLAFAILMPEYVIYLYFILPVKMRWWGWATGAWLCFSIARGGWHELLQCAVGLFNFAVFFAPIAYRAARLRSQAQAGQRVFQQAKREAVQVQARHCEHCKRGPEAGLRLCTCERCGADGRFWCEADLPGHLGLDGERPGPEEALPKKKGKSPAQKRKRKG